MTYRKDKEHLFRKLNDLADLLEKNKERFSLSQWTFTDNPTSVICPPELCNTPACVAGYSTMIYEDIYLDETGNIRFTNEDAFRNPDIVSVTKGIAHYWGVTEADVETVIYYSEEELRERFPLREKFDSNVPGQRKEDYKSPEDISNPEWLEFNKKVCDRRIKMLRWLARGFPLSSHSEVWD